MIICRDYNGDIGAGGGPRGISAPTPQGNEVIIFLKRHNLYACNMQANAKGPIITCTGPNFMSTLDYISVPITLENDVTECIVLEWNVLNTSDHVPVSALLHINGQKSEQGEVAPFCAIRWDKLSVDEIRERYEDPLTPEIDMLVRNFLGSNLSEELLDTTFDEITNSLLKASANLPRSRYRKHMKPYWCEDVNVLKRAKIAAYIPHG